MAILYEDDLFIVKQNFFGPWRVVNKTTGATIAPELHLQEKIGLTWPKIRSNRQADKNLKRFAEDVMMQTFALASVHPKGEAGRLIAETGPDALAFAFLNEAIERLRLVGIR